MARKTYKRENGTGSIYKRKDVKKRPWVAVSAATYDEMGKKHQLTIGSFATYQEAHTALLP